MEFTVLVVVLDAAEVTHSANGWGNAWATSAHQD
jgi:hypothetical protein